jgi:hypothetical protein
VIKQCYDEVWTILESHRGALWAGVAALSEQREMLGGELRDVFDKHPPQVCASFTCRSVLLVGKAWGNLGGVFDKVTATGVCHLCWGLAGIECIPCLHAGHLAQLLHA